MSIPQNGLYDRDQSAPPLPAQMEAEEKDVFSDFDFPRLFLVTKKSLPWVLILLILSGLLCWTYLRYTKPIYQSSSILKLDNKNDAMVLGLDNIRDGQSQNNLRNLYGEIEFIKSRMVFDKALEKLNLNVSYFAKGKILNEEKYKNSPFIINYNLSSPAFYDFRINIRFISDSEFRLSYEVGKENFQNIYKVDEEVVLSGLRFTLSKSSTFTSDCIGLDYFFQINSKEKLISYLENNLSVEIINADANTLKVNFQDFNAFKAKEIVETIDTVYLQQTISNKSKAQEQTLKFLEENLEITEAKLAAAETRLEVFMKKNKTVDVKADVGRLITKIEELEAEKMDLRLKVTLLNELQDLILEDKDLQAFVPSLASINDSKLFDLISELNEAQQKKALSLTRSKENTYVVKAQNITVENLKTSILTAISQNRKLLFQQLSEIDKQIMQFEKNFIELPGKETEFTRIKRFYDLYEKYYLLLMEKKAEYGIAKAGMVPNFVVLSPATVNEIPISPNKPMIYLFGGSLGFLLGIGLIFLRYVLDNTITNQKELERSIPATVLGSVPAYTREKLEVSRLVVNGNPKSIISEALRTIRTNLDFLDSAEKRIISVTSTVSGEGKTFVAVNLGGIIALSEKKVVIIDLDMRKPKVHKAFDNENFAGISTILINKTSLNESILPTSVPNLDFIPAGPTPPNPSELIMRPAFADLLKVLRKTYDVIIIDTPPVGLVTDAVLVMKHVDIPLYVVRANYSKKNVKNAINKLMKTTGYNNLSIILNGANTSGGYGYGGYEYGYGNGYYDQERNEDSIINKVKKLIG